MKLSIDYRSNEAIEVQLYKQLKVLILTHRFSLELLEPLLVASMAKVDLPAAQKAFDILVQDQILGINENQKYFMAYQEIADVNQKTTYSVIDIIKLLKQELTIKTFGDKYLNSNLTELYNLGFEKNEVIYYHERIYYGDNLPKAYMKLYFSKKHLPNCDQEDMRLVPYYELVAFNVDDKLKSKRTLNAINFSDKINQHLNQSKNSSGLSTNEFYYDKDNKLVLYVKMYLNLNYFLRLKGKY